jgi:hypothetical protein
MENQEKARYSQPETEPNKPTSHKTYVLVLLIVILFFANLVAGYPGVPNFDSNNQYSEAVNGHFSDWHPPIMAWLWSMLRVIADGTGPLFVVHVFFYWMGIGLIALTLSRIGRNPTAWAIVAVGAFPWFTWMNTQILKDVGMAASFLTGYSLCFSYRVRGVKVHSGIIVIATIFIVYGVLVRVNGIFAGAPLIIYVFWPKLFYKPILFPTGCVMLIAIAIPVSDLFNHKILRAEHTYPMQSLKLFDELGIAYFAEDTSIIQSDLSTAIQLVSDCYTPVRWDTLDHRAMCRQFRTGWPQGRTWIFAILKHPLAYAEHRLLHFNSELYFIVPRHHADWRLTTLDLDHPASPAPERKDPTTIGEIASYLSPEAGIVTPVFALAVGFVVLVLRVRTLTRQPPQLEIATLCLVVSGILYTLGYLLVGVSTEPRYHYWSMVAIFLAGVMCVSEELQRFGSSSRKVWACIVVIPALALAAVVVVHAICGDALSQLS